VKRVTTRLALQFSSRSGADFDPQKQSASNLYTSKKKTLHFVLPESEENIDAHDDDPIENRKAAAQVAGTPSNPQEEDEHDLRCRIHAHGYDGTAQSMPTESGCRGSAIGSTQ
jgi:hypothetical protein